MDLNLPFLTPNGKPPNRIAASAFAMEAARRILSGAARSDIRRFLAEKGIKISDATIWRFDKNYVQVLPEDTKKALIAQAVGQNFVDNPQRPLTVDRAKLSAVQNLRDSIQDIEQRIVIMKGLAPNHISEYEDLLIKALAVRQQWIERLAELEKDTTVAKAKVEVAEAVGAVALKYIQDRQAAEQFINEVEKLGYDEPKAEASNKAG